MRTIERLKRRADFIRAARSGQSVKLKTMIVQSYAETSNPEPASGVRLGITASRRVGGAVQRNRAKRRLREVARIVLSHVETPPSPCIDIVIIARSVVVTIPFQQLLSDFSIALHKLGISK